MNEKQMQALETTIQPLPLIERIVDSLNEKLHGDMRFKIELGSSLIVVSSEIPSCGIHYYRQEFVFTKAWPCEYMGADGAIGTLDSPDAMIDAFKKRAELKPMSMILARHNTGDIMGTFF